MSDCREALQPVMGDAFSEDELGAICLMQPGLHLFSKGDALIREKDTDRTIFLQLTGRSIVTKTSQLDMVLGELLPGYVFGEVTFFNGGKRTANITAAEETSALMIDPYALNELPEELQIKLLSFLLPRITLRLGFLNNLLLELAKLELETVGEGYQGNPLGGVDFDEDEDYFDAFSEEEARMIVAMEPGPQSVAPGLFLCREGLTDGTMFLLLEGELSLERNELPGISLMTLGPGQMINFGVLFGDEKRYGNFKANDQVAGLRIDVAQFQQLPASVRLIMIRKLFVNVINRLKNYNLGLLKLEHMKQNIWFGG